MSDLRSTIARAEFLVSRLSPRTPQGVALELFACLDRTADLYRDLAEQGSDLRAEAVRIDTVHRTLAENGRQVVRVVGKRDRWSRLRAGRQPAESAWWWRLDQHVALVGRARALRAAKWMLFAILGIAVVAILYARYVGPDEQTLKKARYLAKADACVEQGEFECALEQVNLAVGLAPEDPELCLKAAVLMEAAGRREEADAAYARAVGLYQDPSLFLAMRGQEYISLGWFAEAALDARAAISMNDQLALPHCTLGSASEGLGSVQGAIDAFDRCADLAFMHQQDELYVLASSRLALLLQAR